MSNPTFKLEFGSVISDGHCFASVVSDDADHDGRTFEVQRTGRVRLEDGSTSGVRYTVSENAMFLGEIEVPTGEFIDRASGFNEKINELIGGVLSGDVKADMSKQIESVKVEPFDDGEFLFRLCIVIKQHSYITFHVYVRPDGSWAQSSMAYATDAYLQRISAEGWVGWNHREWDAYVEEQIKIALTERRK